LTLNGDGIGESEQTRAEKLSNSAKFDNSTGLNR